MKHTIVIDDNSSVGKHLLGIIKSLSPTSKGVDFVSNDVLEDAAIARMIEAGLKSGLANKNQVLKKLGLK